MFFRLKTPDVSGKKKYSVFLLALLAGASLLGTLVWAQTKGHSRPGERTEAPPVPLSYPDLSACAQLKDPSIYKGDRKILKYIYPGRDGWLFRSADFRMDFTMPDKTFDYMKQVNERLAAKGIELVVLLQPSRGIMMQRYIDQGNMPEGYDPAKAQKNYKALISKLNRAGIEAPDVSDVPSDIAYFFKGDPHWRREGSHWTAQRLARVIRQYPAYKDMKREEFSNEITWWLESEKGEFDEFVEKACDVERPPERRPMWATTSLAGAIDEAALFGDVTYPDIAIVGTSNTAHEEDFNFVGALKQELNTDIRNRALSAGAFSGASLVFYATDEFHDHPPKVVIWEFLSHHDFDDYDGFRQIIPAISGACTESAALASAALDITAPADVGAEEQEPKLEKYLIFEDLEDKAISGKDSYLYLEVLNPAARALKVGILYANGEADEVKLTRSRRVDNNGKYYLRFNPDIEQNLLMIQIETDKRQGDIKARICKDSL